MRQYLHETCQSLKPQEYSSVFVTALVTAGPRKGPVESFELGEDAAGVANCGTLTAFWLADGTTSSSTFGSLSTRRLAQDMGAEFLQLCSRIAPLQFDSVIPREFCEEMCHSVQLQWQKRVEEFWLSMKPEHREGILLRLPQNTTGSRSIDWSVVFVCGVIDSRSNSAMTFHCGDCFGYFFTGQKTRVDLLPRSGRLFLRLRILSDESLPMVTFVPNEETFAFAKIEDLAAFVCMTDGIAKSRVVSRWLNANDLSHADFLKQVLSVRAEMDDDRGVVYGTVQSHSVLHAADLDVLEQPSNIALTDQNLDSESTEVDCNGPLPSALPDEDTESCNE